VFPPEVVQGPEAIAASRRDRKKSRTRADLVRAATALFADRGYDRTTIDDITEAVDVSPRTFFRYFASKEDVLFPPTDFAAFLAAVRAQPLALSDVDAVRDAYLSLLPLSVEATEYTLLFKKAVLSTPALEGRNAMLQRQFRDQIAVALGARRGLSAPDDVAVIAASVAQTVLQLVYDRWAAADGTIDLATSLLDHFALIDHVGEPSRNLIAI
jgi:TetR/AcrR family transcriptional regulator, regulator of mycofactocin system